MSPNITYADWLENYAAYPYKTATIKRYVSILEAAPEKLNLSLPRGIMEIDDPDEFENACIAVATSDGYEQLNKSRHGELSAAMAAYRKYLAFVGKVSAAGGTGRVY